MEGQPFSVCWPPFLSQNTPGGLLWGTEPTPDAIFMGAVGVTSTPHQGQRRYSAIRAPPAFDGRSNGV